MSSWRDAVDVVESCLAAGVAEFVICAGARNGSLLEAIARAEAAGKVRVWWHFEERSAGFFALGRIMDSAQPCAVVTTSGTAAAELLPAVIEAFYQAKPLVAITADRPQEFRGSGAPQAIEQEGIFGVYAAANGLEAWKGKQPLHLNIPLDEGLLFDATDFMNASVACFKPAKDRLDLAGLARWLREGVHRGMVVMIGGLEAGEREDVFHFCQNLAVPVVAEGTSGLREALQALAIHDEDRVLAAKPPGKVLRLGQVPSGRFWRDLENLLDVSVWSICRNGLPGLARDSHVTCGPLERVIPALGEVEMLDDAIGLLEGSAARQALMDELLEAFPDSEPAWFRHLSHHVAIANSLFLGNSLPIREWNRFAQWRFPVPEVRANRGANGIDGQLSTWLGCTAHQTNAWAIVGDLTALYDLTAPLISGGIEQQGRVLAIIHNRGGKIFQRLPRLSLMSSRAQEWMLNSHQHDLAMLGKFWGFSEHAIKCIDDLDILEQPVEGARLLVVHPDEEQTQAFWKAAAELRLWRNQG